MPRERITVLPSVQRRITAVGQRLRLARLRRRLTTSQVAERAGIARSTLYRIELGDPSVAFGNYATVLFCLGLDEDLDTIAHDDELGRKLQDAGLGMRSRGKYPDRDRGRKQADA